MPLVSTRKPDLPTHAPGYSGVCPWWCFDGHSFKDDENNVWLDDGDATRRVVCARCGRIARPKSMDY